MKPIDWTKHKVWTAEMIVAERDRLDTKEWGSPREQEVKRRIDLCVATYAYEVADSPIMSDSDWDRLAQFINPKLGTGHPLVDEFFVTQFSPMTGMWIHHHPELGRIKEIYEKHHAGA